MSKFERDYPREAQILAWLFFRMRLIGWAIGLVGFFNLTRSWGPGWWHIPIGVVALLCLATLYPQKKWGILDDDERD